MTWGPGSALIGLLLAAALFLSAVATSLLLTEALGYEPVPEDIGDIFEKSAAVVSYADEASLADFRGDPRPKLPDLLADVVAARIFIAVAALSTFSLCLLVVGAARRDPLEIFRQLGLGRFEGRWLWQMFLLTLLAYVTVIAYSEIVTALDIGILIPEQQAPRAALRDPFALFWFGVLAVLAAPLGEEFLFRGLVFGGLSRWGFWPAAAISGFAFALSHADPGTMIPFTAIGVMFAWQLWRTGSLWPAIICHGYFNGTSFALLALTT